MSKARLTTDVEINMDGGGFVPKGEIVTTVVDSSVLEGDSPIPPDPGTMRIGLIEGGGYVILTSDNCEAVE